MSFNRWEIKVEELSRVNFRSSRLIYSLYTRKISQLVDVFAYIACPQLLTSLEHLQVFII
jgi:hypothetical protein